MTNQSVQAAQNISLGDIYYVIFRHKWKILICSLAGFVSAAVMFRNSTPPYQSEARLLVRYIISDPAPTGPGVTGPAPRAQLTESLTAIMNTEMELLTSANLAKDVAESYGAEKILAKSGGGKDIAAAASVVRSGLRVVVPLSTPVLHLTFRHPDSEIVQPVLTTVVERYLKRHVEAHRAAGFLTEQQSQELENLKVRLSQVEEDLRRQMAAANIGLSLEATKEALVNQMMSNRREVAGYEAEIAARVAVLEQLKQRLEKAGPASTPSQEPDLPLAVLEEHKRLYARVTQLQTYEQELLTQYTVENPRVKDVQNRLSVAEAALTKLRQDHPRLLSRVPATANAPTSPDPDASEALATAAQVTAYQAKIKELNNQHEKLRADVNKIERGESLILDLRRQKNSLEQHYVYLRQRVDEQRIREAMGQGKVTNIKDIQTPTPPFREPINYKQIALFAVGGVIVGVAWAFLVELYLDRSVRRPADLARMLRAPLFLSIPKLKIDSPKLALPTAEKTSTPSASTILVPTSNQKPTHGDALQPFHETLRDRLISYFESRNLTHKPKLVAVTSLTNNAGVTTTAAGLARTLSETGEGNVLLVDMTVGEGAAKEFVKGRETCGLDELLEARSQGHVQDNLYVVTENTNGNSDRLSRNMPQRFSRLIPKLKASDFDYIIFDMPVVNQLSITPRLASFMDMVLLVVESETTDRDLVQGACAMLAESKTHVGVVLNKTRHYIPGRRNQELMAL